MSLERELYLDLFHHLIKDPKPSSYIRKASSYQEFKKYPLNLILRLKDTEQNPKWHPEGNVFEHTLMVVDEAANLRQYANRAPELMWAALLHDIGKPAVTREKHGKLVAYDHDKEGARMAKGFLEYFKADYDFADRVSKLIRYHMQILYYKKKMNLLDIEGIKENCNVNDLVLLCLSDRLGRGAIIRQVETENAKEFHEEILKTM